MQFHRIDKSKDKHFWSVRVSGDIRLIVHKTADSLLLCYVDHHDKAYGWAERRKLETHPKTGAAQLVEIRERIEEITVQKFVETMRPALAKPLLFADCSEDELLGYGVPPEWLSEVRQANEDSVLDLAVGEGIDDSKVHAGGDDKRCGCELPRLTASNRRPA